MFSCGSTTPNAKINQAKNEIPSIANLATATVLSVVENKTLDHGKSTPEFNKLTVEMSAARLAQANLASEIANFVKKKKKKKTDFGGESKNSNKKITSNKTKHLLVESELNEL